MKEDIAVKVQKQLFELQDLKYRDFHDKLMPTIDKGKVVVNQCHKMVGILLLKME